MRCSGVGVVAFFVGPGEQAVVDKTTLCPATFGQSLTAFRRAMAQWRLMRFGDDAFWSALRGQLTPLAVARHEIR